MGFVSQKLHFRVLFSIKVPRVCVCLFTDNSLFCLEVKGHSKEPLLLEYEVKIRHLWNSHINHQANLIYRNLIQESIYCVKQKQAK